jgi:hypothetical protein
LATSRRDVGIPVRERAGKSGGRPWALMQRPHAPAFM